MQTKAIVGFSLAGFAAVGLLVFALAPVDGTKARPVSRSKAKPIKAVAPPVVAVTNAEPEAVAKNGERTDAKAGKKNRKPRRKPILTASDTLTPEEHALADRLQDVLDGNETKKTIEEAHKLLSHRSEELRLRAVSALGLSGEDALVDLTKAMTDESSEVASEARNQVENILMGITDSHRAFELAASYADSFGDDEESTTMFFGILTSSGNQIIEPDDADSAADVAKAKRNRAAIAEKLAGMIEKKGNLAEKAKEAYRDISGEDWAGLENAERWVNDIEDPKPSESEENP